MSNSFCPGALRAALTTAFLTLICLLPIGPHAARADVAGQQAAGSANYPNGGLNFVGDMDISHDLADTDSAGGIYSAALDPTTGYFLTGSIRAMVAGYTDTADNQSASLLSKMKLYRDGIEQVSAWCHAHRLGIAADRDSFICVAWSQCLAEQALIIDRCELPHETEFGAVLGYPPCCCEMIAQFGDEAEAIERAEAEAGKWKFTGQFAKIDPAGYHQGRSLICHLPCCEHCEPSLQIAVRALNFIRDHWNSGLFGQWSSWVIS